ncbi:MAG TPA: YicC/YloC family endoribonuclease [Acidobacteriota bacterium]|nr:YicC/YloC family endoribonuclease [Acidobacteriota bacterium]
MISSMTGFGRGEVARDGYKATFEVSSVNGRHLDVSLRLPRWLFSLEMPLKSLVNERLSRGKVVCQLTLEKDTPGGDIGLNEPLAEVYIKVLTDLAARHGLEGGVTVSDLLRLPDLWSSRTEGPNDVVEGILRETLNVALDELIAVRSAEGAALAADLRARLETVNDHLVVIRKEAAGLPDAIREKLSSCVKQLFGSGEYDPQRLAQEIAYLAERADITEECVRLDVHRGHFAEALESDQAVGRRLNFLLQELNREANTIGSKSASAETATRVVALKEELERIREQVQNIE